VIDSLPSILKLNKSFDLRALHNSEPTRAASELLDVVKSLTLEREFFGVLQKTGIVWKTISIPPSSFNHNKEEAANTSFVPIPAETTTKTKPSDRGTELIATTDKVNNRGIFWMMMMGGAIAVVSLILGLLLRFVV